MNDLTKQGLTTLGIVLGVSLGMQAILISPMHDDLQRIEARLERIEQADSNRFDSLETTIDERVDKLESDLAITSKRLDWEQEKEPQQ